MKIYEAENQEEIVETLLKSLEEETQQRIFTMRILDESKNFLEVVIIFENKSVFLGRVVVQTIKGRLACRLRGNYI